MLVADQQRLRFLLNLAHTLKRHLFPSKIAREKIAELTAPERRCHPFAVRPKPRFSFGRKLPTQKEIGNDVGVNRNHGRPSRLKASMSLAVNLPFGKESRIARALAMTSSAVARPGSSTDSRQTIASLFKLRL